MIFRRKIMKELESWKEKNRGKTALLIEGARRVGKSTVAEEFGKAKYRSYMLINFSMVNNRVKGLFEDYLLNLDDFFQLLQAEMGVRLFRRESLIIFDEIQRFPRAREAIKALVQDGRYDYLETGSLLTIRENVENILLPSEEQSICMYPMDFEEFCSACGQDALWEYICDCFQKKRPLDDRIHHKAMLLIRQYMIVGGMPQSVSAYLENDRSFIDADEQKRNILTLYRNDIVKIGRKYSTDVLQIYDQIPGFLSKHEKRVTISRLADKNASILADSFFWLANSMIANECFACSDPNIGLSLHENRTLIKCYMGDTGLLLSHAFSKKEIDDGGLYKRLLTERLSINQGMVFENLVAQMLTSNGYELYFYTHYDKGKHRNDIEIDFLLSNGSKTAFKVSPIEVKSTKNYAITSIERFCERFRGRVKQPYVIHPKNLKAEGGILYLPIYMTPLL